MFRTMFADGNEFTVADAAEVRRLREAAMLRRQQRSFTLSMLYQFQNSKVGGRSQAALDAFVAYEWYLGLGAAALSLLPERGEKKLVSDVTLKKIAKLHRVFTDYKTEKPAITRDEKASLVKIQKLFACLSKAEVSEICKAMVDESFVAEVIKGVAVIARIDCKAGEYKPPAVSAVAASAPRV